MNLPAKRVLKLFGKILVVLAIGFVVWRLYFYAGEIDFSRFDGWRWCAILVLIFLSAIANALLARAWRQLLQNLGCRISVDQAVKIHGVSQLARYIPGNIFHLAGRQALGMAAGIDAKVLAKSTVWELALIALAASLFSIWVLPRFGLVFPMMWGQIGFGLCFLGLARVVGYIFSRFVTWAFISHTVFLAVSGGIFLILLWLSHEAPLPESIWTKIIGAYVVAWLLGLLVPGAPAGIGIREAALIYLLNGVVPQVEVLTSVMLARAVTVIGDLLFFLYAFFKRQPQD
ncbi:hypothetical protein [Acidovorax sp. SDU_ACID1]|uniref:hypothetical protein n=1 Tax=Acidovorax sp. SDU_ACID1 TaxID=3136632 RepID=UPI003873B3AC